MIVSMRALTLLAALLAACGPDDASGPDAGWDASEGAPPGEGHDARRVGIAAVQARVKNKLLISGSIIQSPVCPFYEPAMGGEEGVVGDEGRVVSRRTTPSIIRNQRIKVVSRLDSVLIRKQRGRIQ